MSSKNEVEIKFIKVKGHKVPNPLQMGKDIKDLVQMIMDKVLKRYWPDIHTTTKPGK